METGTGVANLAFLTPVQLQSLTSAEKASIRTYIGGETSKVTSYESEEYCKHKTSSTRVQLANRTCGSTMSARCVHRLGDEEKVDLLSIGLHKGALLRCGDNSSWSSAENGGLRRLVASSTGLEVHLQLNEDGESVTKASTSNLEASASNPRTTDKPYAGSAVSYGGSAVICW